MNDLKTKITKSILAVMPDLNREEKVILTELVINWGDGEVTQKDIIDTVAWQDAYTLNGSVDTVRRRIRKHIRNLRVAHKLPILHNAKGHFLPEHKDEVEAFVKQLEIEAKNRASSSMETYKVMKEVAGIDSTFMNQIDSIGGQIIQLIRQ